MKKKFIYTGVIISLLVLIDQASKALIIQNLAHAAKKITFFLNFLVSYNYGISFGLFAEYTHYSNKIFLICNSVILLIIFIFSILEKDKAMFTGYCYILGGGIGNLVDRVNKGAVVDFIDLHYKNFHFPIFNLADMFISLGFLIVAYKILKSGKP